MTEALSTTSLVLLVAVLPGYLTLWWWSRNRTWGGFPGDIHTVLESLAISALVQLAVSPLTLWKLYPVREHLMDHPVRLIGWAFLSLVLLPYVCGAGVARLSDWVFPGGSGRLTGWRAFVALFIRPSPEPSLWDWLVMSGRADGKFLLIEFTDGRRVAGTVGLGSIATTSPEVPGVLLFEEWALDEAGNIYAKVPGTAGTLVPDVRNARIIRILEGANG